MMQLGELYKLAGALNIEGGFPKRDLLKNNINGKWVNLVLVLDRPLVDNITFDDLFANNKYPLLESAIDNLNEHQFLAAYMMIIGYYMENGKKDTPEPLKITIHIHQDVTCQPLVDLLKKFIELMRNDLNIKRNVMLDFRTDQLSYIKTVHEYESTDILISLSQCAGLDPNLLPGHLIVSDTFIPYDISNKKVNINKTYKSNNDLIMDLKDILKSKFNQYAVEFINKNYNSENPKKINHSAKLFILNDFEKTQILQVNELWNPTNSLEMVNIN